MKIKKLEHGDEKYLTVLEVLKDLPEWFGLEESLNNYALDAKNLNLWAAYLGEELVGFISLKETSNETGEIHCMGVKKEFHRRGIGKELYLELEKFSKNKYSYLQVKTVAKGRYQEYDKTIEFYKRMGFSELEVFPSLWDEFNPCLIMIKSLY